MSCCKSILQAFIPFQQYTFLYNFNEKLSRMNIAKNKADVHEKRQIYGLLLIQGLYFLMVVLLPQHTRYHQLITFNYPVFNGMPVIVNVELFVFWLSVAIETRILLTDCIMNKSILAMFSILFNHKTKFLISPFKFQFKSIMFQYFVIRQTFVITLDLFIVINYYIFMKHLLMDFDMSATELALNLLCFHICFLLFVSTFAVVINVGSVLSLYNVTACFIILTRLKIMSKKVSKFDRLVTIRLLYYIHHQVKTLQFLVEIEKILGFALTIFLAASCPLFATSMSLLLTNEHHLSPILLATMCMLVLGFVFGSIVMHCILAHISGKLHSPYKQILSLNNRMHKCSLMARLRVANSIEAFHVKKRYGVSYHLGTSAPIGLVSMRAFVKVRLFFNISKYLIIFSF